MTANDSSDRIIISPGPVHVDPARWRALPPLHHRSNEFRRIVLETEGMLRELLGAGADAPVYMMTASGTGAMEAAVANVTRPGSRVLVVTGGKFGDRWDEICRTYGCSTEVLRFPPGAAVDIGQVISRIERFRPEFCAVTHVESSTGLLLPLRDLAETLPEPRPILMVDAISSLGAEELEMKAWNLDVVVGSSQKALAAPPGLGFACLGHRAIDLVRECPRDLYYISFRRYERGRRSGDTPFTPAVHVHQMVHRSLCSIRRLGWASMRERHRAASSAFLRAADHLSLAPLPERPSSAVQALKLPESCWGGGFVRELAERHGIIAAGGQGELGGKIIRTGFLGLYGVSTIKRVISAIADLLVRGGCRLDADSAERELRAMAQQDEIFEEILRGLT